MKIIIEKLIRNQSRFVAPVCLYLHTLIPDFFKFFRIWRIPIKFVWIRTSSLLTSRYTFCILDPYPFKDINGMKQAINVSV